MRTVLLTIGFISTLILNLHGQIHDQEKFNGLKERSEILVFGELVEKSSFWNPSQRLIFTTNKIKLFSTLKGEHNGKIEIITDGGEVGDIAQQWSHSTELPDGAKGYFFLHHITEGEIMAGGFLRFIGHDGFIPLKTRDFPQQPESFLMTDTIVEFGFDNITIDLPDLSFDVLIRSNVGGLNFGKGELYLQYPSEVFGTDAVANNWVSATKGDVINSSQYSIALTDEEENILEAFVDGGCVAPTGAEDAIPISTSFQTFMRVSLQVQDFNALGSISMDKLRMEGRMFYYDGESSTCKPFTDIIVPDPIETGLVCSITSFRDTIVTAGTGDVLTIVGMNFDTVKHLVEFPNADDGGATFTAAQPADILKWKNDTIQVIVPSTPSPAGTGIFRVTTSGGMMCPSPKPLDVCYAVRARRNGAGVEQRVHLGDVTGGNKYVFLPDSTMANNADAKATVEQVLCDWNKHSDINWELGAVSHPASFAFDSVHRVFVAPAAVFGTGVPAKTMVTSIACQTVPPTQSIFYSGDIDFAIRDNLNTLPIPVTGGWHFDHTTAPAANEYDFYTVALHEMGHGPNHRHAMPLPKVMIWESNAGTTLRVIDAKGILGAKDIMAASTAAMGVSFLCNPIDTASLCGSTFTTEIKDIGQLTVYPNPAGDYINIDLDMSSKATVAVQMSDLTGKVVLHNDFGDLQRGQHSLRIELQEDIPSGLYVLSFRFGEDNIQSFKLIKL